MQEDDRRKRTVDAGRDDIHDFLLSAMRATRRVAASYPEKPGRMEEAKQQEASQPLKSAPPTTEEGAGEGTREKQK